MTQLSQIPRPSPIVPQALGRALGEGLSQQDKQQRTDALIESVREQTPTQQLEKRQVERLSIAEMNAASWEDIQRKFRRSRADRRTPIIKVLDLIDLPRNALFNLAAPGIASQRAEQGETAAFGLGRVNASDLLKALGVENQVARGVAGFVGDVALDPLTYLGPAGFGVSLATKSGRTVDIAQAGRRALKEGVTATARGGQAADETVRNIIDLAGFSPVQVGALREAGQSERQIRQAIDTALRGGGPESLIGRSVQRGLSAIGGDVRAEGGFIAERFFRQAPELARETAASRAFVERFGRSTGSRSGSFRVGRGGSQVAHIPFTQRNFQVPAFTGTARRNIAAGQIARASVVGQAPDVVRQAQDIAAGFEQTVNDIAREGRLQGGKSATRAKIEDQFEGFTQRDVLDIVGHRPLADVLQSRLDSLPEDVVSDYAAFLTHTEILNRTGQLHRDDIGRLAGVRAGDLVEGDEFLLGGRSVQVVNRTDDAVTLRTNVGGGDEIEVPIGGLDSVTLENEGVSRSFTIGSDEIIPLESGTLNDNAARVTELRTQLESLQQRLSREGAQAASSAEEILSLAEHRDQAFAAVERLESLQKARVDAGVGLAENAVNRMHEAIGAAMQLADTANASILNYLNEGERGLVDVAKLMLGTSDDLIGAAAMAGVSSSVAGQFTDKAVAAEWAWRMDARIRQAGIGRGNNLRRTMRVIERLSGRDVKRVFSNMATDLRSQLVSVARRHGLGEANVDKLADLASMKMIARIEARAQDQGRFGFWIQPWDADAGRPVDLQEALRSGRASNWLTELQRARNEGLLDPRVNPGLEKSLDDVADENIHLLTELGDLAEDDGLLRGVMDAYFPTVTTPEARQVLVQQSRLPEFRQSRTTSGTQFREAFQRRRSTWEYRHKFIGEDGSERWVRFFEKDRALLDLTEGQLAKLPPETQQLVADIRAWDELPEIEKTAPRPMDPFALNEAVANGMFAPLTAGHEFSEGFADTNLIRVMATRTAMQQRASARQSFQRIVSQAPSIAIDSEEFRLRRLAGEGSFTTLGGAKAQVGSDSRGRPMLTVGGRRYRHLDTRIIDKDNPMHQMVEGQKGIGERMFEESVAEHIENYARLFNQGEFDSILRFFDQLTGLWKSTTLFHPSWTFSELAGNTLLASMALGTQNMPRMVRNYERIIKLIQAQGLQDAPAVRRLLGSRSPGDIADITIRVGDRDMNGTELLQVASRLGIIEADQASEAAALLHANDLAPRLPSEGGPLVSKLESVFQNSERARGWVNRGVRGLQQLRGQNGDGLVRRALAPWFLINRLNNNSMRLATWLTFMELGDDMTSAAEKTLRGLFDYDDLSRFDQNIRRFVFPFWSWLRNNSAYQPSRRLSRAMTVSRSTCDPLGCENNSLSRSVRTLIDDGAFSLAPHYLPLTLPSCYSRWLGLRALRTLRTTSQARSTR